MNTFEYNQEISNEYIKMDAPLYREHLSQIIYYDAEVFVDVWQNPLYMISNFGRLYSKKYNRIQKPKLDRNGYYSFVLISEDKSKMSIYAHILVMTNFTERRIYSFDIPDYRIKRLNDNKIQNIYCPGHPLHNLEWSDSPRYIQYIINRLPKEYNEEFRVVPFAPKYLVSNMGKVYSMEHDIFLVNNKTAQGYYAVQVNSDGPIKVHRLVMLTFAYEPGCERLFVHHKDGNKTNNVYFGKNHPDTNLEWCTSAENTRHAKEDGLMARGDMLPQSVFSTEFVKLVCSVINDNPHLRSPQIAQILGINTSRQFVSLVSCLRRGISWVHITKDYPNVLNKNNV